VTDRYGTGALGGWRSWNVRTKLDQEISDDFYS